MLKIIHNLSSDLQFDLILSPALFSLLRHTIIFAFIKLFHDFVCLNVFLHMFGKVFLSLCLRKIVSLLINIAHILLLHKASPNLNDNNKHTHVIVLCEWCFFTFITFYCDRIMLLSASILELWAFWVRELYHLSLCLNSFNSEWNIKSSIVAYSTELHKKLILNTKELSYHYI